MKYILFVSAIFYSVLAGAKTNVNFVPSSIKQGDAVELILSSNTLFQGVPNLSILEKDFVIGGQQQKQSTRWINGQMTASHQLIYTLFPNKSGEITVQGLKIGNETLPAATLKVTKDAAYEQTGNLDLVVHCSHNALYPSQKLLCQINLTDTMGLLDGELVPPESADGTWEQMIPLVPSSQSTPGQNIYQSIFAFTPNKSGKIEIPPFTFKGMAPLKTRPQMQAASMTDLLLLGIQSTASKPVVVQSNPFILNVKEKPADYHGWWLPSSQVTLREQYDLPNPLHIGEPITRTLTLVAKDVEASALPVPSVAQTSGFKVYANPEKRENISDGAKLSVTLTFVPTQSGAMTLPAISVPWFNTKTETTQTASVPAKDIFVTAEAAPAPVEQPADLTPIPPTEDTPQNLSSPTQEPAPQPAPAATETIPWLLLIGAAGIAFIIGVLVTVILLKRSKNTSKDNKKKSPLPDLYPF